MNSFSGDSQNAGIHMVPKPQGIAPRADRATSAMLLIGFVVLAIVAVQAYAPPSRAYADPRRFDYASVLSPAYVYRGNYGVLLLDNRNGNVWFFGKTNDFDVTFHDPVLITRLPLEKLDGTSR
jgi:hypothetical protein